jgi:5-methyltetrahydrofolate--homocysteine methyltransferase
MNNFLKSSNVNIIPYISGWTENFTNISKQSLEYCENFPKIAKRYEAWWNQDCIDRPIFQGAANSNPDRPMTKRLEFLHEPEIWFNEKIKDLQQEYRVGDTLPTIRVDFGPVMLGGLLGAKTELRSENDTSWTHPFINDRWDNSPEWSIKKNNSWWNLLIQLFEKVCDDASSRYIVCTPSLGSSGDVLLTLRGATGLCMDLFDKSEFIHDAVPSIFHCWSEVYIELNTIAYKHKAGIVPWLGIWSECPYIVAECDFNALISPDDFRNHFFPEIELRSKIVGRAVNHLDGVDATRHIDSILESNSMQAVQFVPGAGAPSMIPWLDMCRNIQNKGKSLLLHCPPEEILTVCKSLRPEGLAVCAYGKLTPQELDDLYDEFNRLYI